MTSELAASVDSTVDAAFATASHLAAGDAAVAADLLVAAYRLLRDDGEAGRVTVFDGMSVRLAVHSAALTTPMPQPRDASANLVARLTVPQRVALSLHDIEHCPIDLAATVLGVDAAAAVALFTDGAAALVAMAPWETFADMVRPLEQWLDDATRDRVRSAVSSSPANLSTDGRRVRQYRFAPAIALAVGVVALVVAGFAWARPDQPHPRPTAFVLPPRSTAVATPTSTAANPTSTSTSATTTREPVGPVVPGYVVDPIPSGFHGVSAYVSYGETSSGDWIDVWATPGATRTSGRWFAIEGLTKLSSFDFSDQIERVSVGGAPALVHKHQVDGVDEIVVAAAPAPQPLRAAAPSTTTFGGRLRITGFGFDRVGLRHIAASVFLMDGQPVLLGPTAAGDGLREVYSGRASMNVDNPSELDGGRTARYGTDDDKQSFIIDVAPLTGPPLAVSELLLPLPADHEAGDAAGRRVVIESTTGRRSAVIGSNGTDETIVQWIDGDNLVTVSGTAPPGTMVRVAAAVRPATASEWAELAATPPLVSSGVQLSVPTAASFIQIGSTDVADGTWVVSVTPDLSLLDVRDALGGSDVGGSDWSQFDAFALDPTEPLQQYVSLDATLLILVVDDPGLATQMRITAPGSTPAVVPLVSIGAPPSRRVGASFAFTTVGVPTIQLLDAGGGVVKTLAPPQSSRGMP